MPIPRRHSLAGTNGIPAMDERVYIEVDLERTNLGRDEYGTHPVRIHWPDSRSWEIEGVFSPRTSAARSSATSAPATPSASAARPRPFTTTPPAGSSNANAKASRSDTRDLISSPRRSGPEARSC